MEKKKIIVINTHFSGSTGFIANKITKMCDNSFSFFYVCGHGTNGINRTITTTEICRQIITRIDYKFFKPYIGDGFTYWLPTFKLIRVFKKIKPDLIHIHALYGGYINMPILFKFIQKNNIPVIITLHDLWMLTGNCPYFDIAKCEKWKSGCHNCPNHSDFPFLKKDNTKKLWIKKKKIMSKINNITFVGVSKWVKNNIDSSFLSSKSSLTIENGIDTNVFQPKKTYYLHKLFGISKDVKILLSVANLWNTRKGINTLIKLSYDIVLHDCVFVIVGKITDEQKSLFNQNNVYFIDYANNDLLPQIYSDAFLMINPTLEEAFGLVNAESLSCGTPVVSYDTGGCSEIISDEVGIIVQKENYNLLLKSIKEVIVGDKTFNNSKCRSRAQTLFDANKNFRDYIKLYKQMIS